MFEYFSVVPSYLRKAVFQSLLKVGNRQEFVVPSAPSLTSTFQQLHLCDDQEWKERYWEAACFRVDHSRLRRGQAYGVSE